MLHKATAIKDRWKQSMARTVLTVLCGTAFSKGCMTPPDGGQNKADRPAQTTINYTAAQWGFPRGSTRLHNSGWGQSSDPLLVST